MKMNVNEKIEMLEDLKNLLIDALKAKYQKDLAQETKTFDHAEQAQTDIRVVEKVMDDLITYTQLDFLYYLNDLIQGGGNE